MGARINYVFKANMEQPYLVLYSHWGETTWHSDLAAALVSARGRWSDPSYATRITISHMIGEGWAMETGWGLHVNEIGDNEHKIAIIDFGQQTFSLHDEAPHNDLDNKVKGMKNEAIFTQDLSNFCEKYSDQLVRV